MKHNNRFLLLSVAVLFFYNFHGFCEDLELFKNFSIPFIKNYSTYSITNKDSVTFSNGKKFLILKRVASGSGVTFFSIENDLTLVVPTKYSNIDVIYEYSSMIEALKDLGVPVVSILKSESFIPEYLVVKFPKTIFSLNDLFKKNIHSNGEIVFTDNPEIDLKMRVEMMQKLVDLTKKTSNIKSIRGLDSRDVLWDGDNWILNVDLSYRVLMREDFKNYHTSIWSEPNIRNSLPQQFYRLLEDNVKSELSGVLVDDCTKIFIKHLKN